MARKALLSVGMLVGFYAISVALILGFIGLNWVFFRAGRIDFRLILFSAVLIFALVRSTFFVMKKFDGIPGGVPITSADHPALFTAIESIADKMGTTPPDEVYLVQDVNAFVTEDTRLMGLVSKKRVMAIGVGMINAMSVDELESVLAHEYGHYAGSDTRLGAVTYRGWESIVRTLRSLTEGWIRSLFVWYAKLYLRVTRGVSREQELEADRWSARVGGKDAAISAFEKLDHSALLYQHLMNAYVSPLASQKVRPENMYEGYRHLLASEPRAAEVTKYMEENPRTPDPYDSHPPTTERVAALRSMDAPPHERDDRPARVLLNDPDATERQLSHTLFANPADFSAIAWADSGNHFYQSSFGLARDLIASLGEDGNQELLRLLVENNHAEIVRRLRSSPKFNSSNLTIEEIVSNAYPALMGSHEWTVNWDGGLKIPVEDPDALVADLLAGGDRTRSAIETHRLG